MALDARVYALDIVRAVALLEPHHFSDIGLRGCRGER